MNLDEIVSKKNMNDTIYYCNVQKFESDNPYSRNRINTSSNEPEELSNYFYDNYCKMDDDMVKEYVTKCMSPYFMRSIILRHELKHYKETIKEHMTLNEFNEKAIKIFQRYQSKAGGFMLEDTVWSVYKFGEDDTVSKNEILYQNTLALCDSEDKELDEYFDLLKKRLRQLATNMDVEIRSHQDLKSKIEYINIWVTDKSMQDKAILEEGTVGL